MSSNKSEEQRRQKEIETDEQLRHEDKKKFKFFSIINRKRNRGRSWLSHQQTANPKRGRQGILLQIENLQTTEVSKESLLLEILNNRKGIEEQIVLTIKE